MKRLAINANGFTITSFARELNLTWVGVYIYIYIYIYVVHSIGFQTFFVRVFKIVVDS